jgi:hypothetical protein
MKQIRIQRKRATQRHRDTEAENTNERSGAKRSAPDTRRAAELLRRIDELVADA